MKQDELRALLFEKGVTFDEGDAQHGRRFDCKTGEVLNIFDSGKMSFQGKQNSTLAVEVRKRYENGDSSAFDAAPQKAAPQPTNAPPVFVVYGHNIASRDQLELILRRMGLEPIILANLAAAGNTIIEKLERYLGEHGAVGFACVLLTPDDEGHKAGKVEERKYRARQNVVLELGMVLARIGRRRVAILHKETVELPSDISGLIYISFKERVDEIKAKLFNELREAGYAPNANALH